MEVGLDAMVILFMTTMRVVVQSVFQGRFEVT